MTKSNVITLEDIANKLHNLENDIVELKNITKHSKVEVIKSDYQKLLPALREWGLLVKKEVIPMNSRIDDIYYKLDSLRPVLRALAAFIFILILVKLF